MSFEIVSGVINGLVAKTELTDITIVRRLYTHGTAHCTLGTDDDMSASYAALAEVGAQALNADVLLQWKAKDDSDTKDCFRGYVRSVRAERLEQRAYLHFECVSYSARMDQIRNFRVWEKCTLKDVCDYLIGKNQGELDYGEGGASATGKVKIPLSVQYEETDFAYLSRMLHAWGIPLCVDDLSRKVLIGKPSITSQDTFPDADDAHWNTTSLEAGLVPIQTSAEGTGSAAPGIARGKILEFNAALTRTPGHLYEPKADAEHQANYKQGQKLEDATNFDVNSVVCRARWLGGVYDFAPGALVDFAEQSWLVRDVSIQGHGSEAVAQEFTLLDKLMPLVPRYRRTSWPTQCLWAHVTKNNSDDPTKSGRIQVEFDWEPLEVTPFTRLCWLQTVTPYGGLKGTKEAGGTSGFLSLPEVGEHVLVQFLDGWDSDAVIIGSVREHAAQDFVYAPHDTKRWQTPSMNQMSLTTTDKGATDIVELMCRGQLIFRGEIKGGTETVVMDLMSSQGDRIHYEKGSGPAQLDIFCSGSIYMHADNNLMLEAGTIQMKATQGTVKIDGTPLVMINCGPTSASPLSLATSVAPGGGGGVMEKLTVTEATTKPSPNNSAADKALVDCILEMCKKDKDVVEKAKKLDLIARDPKHIIVHRYEGGKWTKKKFTSAGSAQGRTVWVNRNLSCDELKDTIYHEVVHTDQPDSMAPANKELDAYTKTEQWTIERGLPGDPRFRKIGPDGKLTVDTDAIKEHVKNAYGYNIPNGQPLPPQVKGETDGGRWVLLDDGTKRKVEEGDAYKTVVKEDLHETHISPSSLHCP